MLELKEGDVYSWSWNDSAATRNYHCLSRIAIAVNCNGELYLKDTFWGYGTGYGNRTFSIEEINKTLDIKYLGNINDFEKADAFQRANYLDVDCLDLNHSNIPKGNFYIRKGAKKNKEKMIRIVQREIEDIENQIACLEQDLSIKKKDIDKINEDHEAVILYPKEYINLSD